MFEFAAKSIFDLKIPAANAGRKARGAKFVVCVETANGTWCELDADDRQHAEALANAWVLQHKARGCSCWQVVMDGQLAHRAFYHKYEEGFIDEDQS